MPNKLTDLEIDKIAGVDRAANQRVWLLVKRDESDVEPIEKFNSEDFSCGCPHCGWGNAEQISKASECPFCGNPPAGGGEKKR